MPLLPAALTSSMLYFQMVIMAGTVMLAYYFEYTDTFTVNVQGFFCHDSAYRKPYPGPEDSSAVPPVLLYSLAAGVPVLVVSPGCPPSRRTRLGRPSPSGWRPRGGSGAAALPSKFLQVVGSPFPRGHSSRARQGWMRRKPASLPTRHPRTPCCACGVRATGRRMGGMGAVGGDGRGAAEGVSPRMNFYFIRSVALHRWPPALRLRLEAEQPRAGEEERAAVAGVWKGLLLPQSGRVCPFYHRRPFRMKVPVGLS